MAIVGERLREARERRGLSLAALAAAAGVAKTTLLRLEHARSEGPRDETLRRLAAALDVEPAWLLGGDAPGGVAREDEALRGLPRLAALAAYRALLDRWRRGELGPGDRRRRAALRAALERTGGVPDELRWRR